MINDFSKVDFVNWEQFVLKVITSVLGKDQSTINNFDQLHTQISSLSNKEFVQEISKVIGYSDIVDYNALLEDETVRDKEPWWTAGENWGMPNGEKAKSSDGKIMTINFWIAP
jgi:hypothetical protein